MESRPKFIALEVILFLVGIAAMAAFAYLMLVLAVFRANVSMYGIILDAGSVHTTVSVYSWPGAKLNGTGEVKELFFCEISGTKGISSFVNAPSEVKNYLMESNASTSCLKRAVSMVDPAYRNETKIFLGATGGMRVLNNTNPRAAQQIMGNITIVLNELGLKKAEVSSTARILSGDEEGKLGWVTVNYLLGNLKQTNLPEKFNERKQMLEVGALDWGGASSQITFPVEKSTTVDSHIEEVSFFNHTQRIFTMSNICYGQSEALNRYFVHLIYQSFLRSGKIKTYLSSPCQPNSKGKMFFARADTLFSRCTNLVDASFKNAAKNVTRDTVFKFIAKYDNETCINLINNQFDRNNCTATYGSKTLCIDPHVISIAKPNTKFLAFSTYWYLVDVLDKKLMSARKEDGQVVQVDRLRTVADKLCLETAERHSLLSFGDDYVQNSCFRARFIYTLLTKGYGFE